jgi:hypothetical protein
MASVMVIGSEIVSRCVEGIEVSVEVDHKGRWLCCEQRYLRFIWGEKAARDWRRRVLMVPGIGWRFWG